MVWDAEQWFPWSGLTGPDWTGWAGWANIARLLWSVQKMLLDKLVSNMHYYSHLAATLHILRDNARELFSHWTRKYGIDSAYKAGITKIPPRPISSRWGRKTSLENYLLKIPLDELRDSLPNILATKNYFLKQLDKDLQEINKEVEEAKAEGEAMLGCDGGDDQSGPGSITILFFHLSSSSAHPSPSPPHFYWFPFPFTCTLRKHVVRTWYVVRSTPRIS